MSTARPSRKRQAAPADTDSPRRTSKTASADADSPGRAAANSGGAQSRHGRPGAAGRRRSGAYQAGVYQGLHEAGIRPNWVAGISIGSINAAIIAGSPEDERVARLRGFWETICRPTGFAAPPWGDTLAGMFEGIPFGFGSPAMNGQLSAFHALVSGQPGFFKPRFPPPYLLHGQGRLPPASTTRLRWPIRCASSSTSTC